MFGKTIWGRLGSSWGISGLLLGAPGAVLGRLGAVLGPSWADLGLPETSKIVVFPRNFMDFRKLLRNPQDA